MTNNYATGTPFKIYLFRIEWLSVCCARDDQTQNKFEKCKKVKETNDLIRCERPETKISHLQDHCSTCNIDKYYTTSKESKHFWVLIVRMSPSWHTESNSNRQNDLQESCWYTKVGLLKKIGPGRDTCMKCMKDNLDNCKSNEGTHNITYVAVHAIFPFRIQHLLASFHFRSIFLNDSKEKKYDWYHLHSIFEQGRRKYPSSHIEHI